MLLSGKDIAERPFSRYSQTVICSWCEKVTTLDLGPQNVQGNVSIHCSSCGKFSFHRVADDWFNAHDKKLQDEREVWKRIPPDAYLTCRRGMSGSPFVYTLYLGKDEPIEYHSRDSVEHKLVTEFDMSWYQAAAIINSSALDPGRKIYFQRLTKISTDIANRDNKIVASSSIISGTPIRFNEYEGVFLRYSNNEGFAVVALNGIGDTEIPMVELEMISVEPEFEGEDEGALQGVEEIEKQVENVEHKIQDAIQDLGGDVPPEPSDSPDVGLYEEDMDIAPPQVEPEDVAPADVEFASEEAEGEEEEDELVIPFDDDLEEEGEEDEDESEEEDEDEEGDEEEGEEDSEKEARQKALSEKDIRLAQSTPAERQRVLQDIINDPNTDPQTRQMAQRKLMQERTPQQQPSAAPLAGTPDQWAQSRQHGIPPVSGNRIKSKTAWWYKTPNELEYSRYPKEVSTTTDGCKATEESKLFPKMDKELYSETCKDPKVKQHDLENTGVEHSARRVAVNRDAQRRVHVHYQNSHDLKRAISVNRNELGIEDIRYILSHYHHVGHLAKHEADEIANWFIGSKPRLLCASDINAEVTSKECLNCGSSTPLDKSGLCSKCSRKKGILCAGDIQKTALLGKGIGIFTPALYKGKEVMVMAIDNTGTRATIQDGNRQMEVEVRDLKPTKVGPYSGEEGDSYSRTRMHSEK